MARVFIAYHLEETSAEAVALADGMRAHLGEASVLTDAEAMAHGHDVGTLDQAVHSCDVVLVLIGRSWVSRVGHERDRVRRSVKSALEGGLPVLPVLVGEETMPTRHELPREIAPLADVSASELRAGDWFAAVPAIVHRVERVGSDTRSFRLAPDRARFERLGPVLEAAARAGVVPASEPAANGMMTMTRPYGGRARGGRVATRWDAGGILAVAAALSVGLLAVGKWLFGWFAVSASEHELERDLVGCTVFAPPSVARGDSILVQVFAHLADDADNARAIATELDPGTKRRVYRTLESRIRRGSRLTFELRIPGAEIPDRVDSLVWRGRAEPVQFAVHVPAELDRSTLLGTVEISVDEVPLGRVAFNLAVGEPSAKEPLGEQARPYTAAFISYASADRAKVLAGTQILNAVRIRYFQDLLDLDPGERWERALYREIDNCDVFLLFWSHEAKASDWVRRELQYALERADGDEDGLPAIRPLIIEGPPMVEPWEELADMQFDDWRRYVIAAIDPG